MNGLPQFLLATHHTQICNFYNIQVTETTQDSETSFTIEVSLLLFYVLFRAMYLHQAYLLAYHCSSIQRAQQQSIDSHMHLKLDRMLVIALELLYSAVSQMTSRTLSEAEQDQLQAKILDLDPLRKVYPNH